MRTHFVYNTLYWRFPPAHFVYSCLT